MMKMDRPAKRAKSAAAAGGDGTDTDQEDEAEADWGGSEVDVSGMLQLVDEGSVTGRILEEKLMEHIDNAHFEGGGDGGVGGGDEEQEREDFYLAPLKKTATQFEHCFQTPAFSMALDIEGP